jgi:metacaspase-1
MRSRALLFGLNYAHVPDAKLSGCINDVRAMATHLKGIGFAAVDVVSDDIDLSGTSAQGIVQRLYDLAVKSFSEDLELVYIHYSGHGTYVLDKNSDEADGRDECLVPSDFKTAGVVPDDMLCSLFAAFKPSTRVVCVFDSCHSGTIGDMLYSWEAPRKVVVENIMCDVKARVVTLSGCMDYQTSADAFGLLGDGKAIGALTACLLLALRENPGVAKDAFALLASVRAKLQERGFQQGPKLCSTHNIARDPVFLP